MKRKIENEVKLLRGFKASRPKIVRAIPLPSDGDEGDIVMGNTSSGAKIFSKIGSKWKAFSADSEDSQDSKVDKLNIVSLIPSTSGSTSSPTKILSPRESGTIYMVNVSTYRVVVQLPPVSRSIGVYFKFIMAEESDAENLNDFAVFTNSAAEDIMGIHKATFITTARSTVQFNAGTANISAGDYMEFLCDGKAWYISGDARNTNISQQSDHSLA